jgi:hypothetical protein
MAKPTASSAIPHRARRSIRCAEGPRFSRKKGAIQASHPAMSTAAAVEDIEGL